MPNLEGRIAALEARYEKLFQVTSDAVLRHRGETLIDCNDATLRMFGLKSIEELRAVKCIADLSPPTQPCGGDSLALAPTKLAPIMTEGVAKFEWVHQRADGTLFPAEVTVSALSPEDSYTSQSIIRDLSVTKQLESDLARHRHAMDAASEGMAILSPEGLFDYANAQLAPLVGAGSARDLVGRAPGPYFPEEAQAALSGEGAWRGQLTITRPDGSETILDASASRLAAGGAVLVLRDVTADVQQRQVKAQTDKFEAIGRLAGTLAHDFNNVLRAIELTADTHKVEGASGARSEELLGRILESTRRASAWLSDLLAVSRRDAVGTDSFDAHAAIRSMATILKPSLGDAIDLRLVFDAPQATLRGDATRLERMLMNLATNARDAMPQGGTLTISTAQLSAAWLRIQVSDDGTGMDATTLERIFEPFFTTKPAGKGTGLGLAMIRRHVVELGGAIGVRSKPGKGTVFSLDFPVYRPTEEPVAPESRPTLSAAPARSGASRKPCVLLADDDTHFRIALTEQFLRAGFDVVTDQDGADAVATYKDRGDRIDCVVLDLDMPRLDGRGALGQLRALDGAAHVLVLSGEVTPAVERELLAAGAAAVLPKTTPFERILGAAGLRPS